MIDPGARPRLAPKARLRHDRLTGRHLLLYPERGLALNETATQVLALCTGEATVAEIVDALVSRYGEEKREAVSTEVRAFLQQLADRNLLRGIEP
jgi:coenzyme PQQ biosynthesis protein PqqD